MQALQLDDAVVSPLIPAQSALNTAAATTPSGSWLDISGYVGDVLVDINVGALTGSIRFQLQVGDDNTGLNAVNAVDARGTQSALISAAGSSKLVIRANGQPKKFLGIVGTIVTGPALVAVNAISRTQAN